MCHRRCCYPCAGDGCPCLPIATLPRGDHPYGRYQHGRRHFRRCRCWRPPLQVAALAGGASARRLPSCGHQTRSRPPLAGWLRVAVCRPLAVAPAAWPQAAAAPMRASCYNRPPSGGCPCGPAAGWPWPQPVALLQGALPQSAAPLHGDLDCSRSPLAGGLAAVGHLPAGGPLL
ncbi:hypothetical protein GW17_00009165 [Ensete ventricosum]|nr:hypothetical protein GW17_00009165 [Ensete ventricosum]